VPERYFLSFHFSGCSRSGASEKLTRDPGDVSRPLKAASFVLVGLFEPLIFLTTARFIDYLFLLDRGSKLKSGPNVFYTSQLCLPAKSSYEFLRLLDIVYRQPLNTYSSSPSILFSDLNWKNEGKETLPESDTHSQVWRSWHVCCTSIGYNSMMFSITKQSGMLNKRDAQPLDFVLR